MVRTRLDEDVLGGTAVDDVRQMLDTLTDDEIHDLLDSASPKELLLIEAALADPTAGLDRYWHDPMGLLDVVLDWGGDRPTDYQIECLRRLATNKRLAVRGPHGLGKDLDVDTRLPTPDGWTTMGDVGAGDVLLDENGVATRVVYAETPRVRRAFRVTFADGTSVVAGAGHLWSAVDVNNRPKQSRHDAAGRRQSIPVDDWRDHWDACRIRETRELAETLRTRGGQLRWRVPTCRPLDLKPVDLPIDPYLLGLWLGDGTTTSGRITMSESDYDGIADRIGPHRPYKQRTNRTGDFLPTGLQAALRETGLLGHKHIPDVYLRSSIEQRRELVRGLWDSDGYRQDGGSDELTTTDPLLRDGIVELLHTLGLSVRVSESRAKLYGRDCGPRWRIGVRFDFDPYHLPRYDWTPRGGQASRHTQRTIVAVEPVGDRWTRCIAVDSPRRLFLASDAMIPTHNTSIASWTILWFAITREAARIDWKILTTASVYRQLSHFLWPEVHKWARRIRWAEIGRRPWAATELLQAGLNLAYGTAIPIASSDPAKAEGAHARQLLFVYDEAKAIPPEMFDATEGAFSGEKMEGSEAYALAISTPGDPIGRFYDIHRSKPGYEDWDVRHVTLEEAIDAGRISPAWVVQRKRQWGETSALFINRVLGDFADASEDTAIPLRWVEAAVERWEERRARAAVREWDFGPMTCVGIDVAYCVDEQTEALTSAGWKRHDQLVDGEPILTLNHHTGLAEWQPLTSVHRFAGVPERRMLSIEQHGHSSLTTLNHRWPVIGEYGRSKYRERRWTTSGRLQFREQIIRTAPVINLPETPKFSDALVELVAWFYTEGNVPRLRSGDLAAGAVLYQSERANPAYCDRIRACLTTLFGPAVETMRSLDRPAWREAYYSPPKREWHLNKWAAAVVREHAPGFDKIVRPEFIASLTRAQLQLFVDTSIDADGTRAGHGVEFSQKIPERLDALQMAVTLLGQTATTGGRGSGGVHLLSISTSPRHRVAGLMRARRQVVAHDGMVWCPKTPNRSWMARRNGKTFFTGNTGADDTTFATRHGDAILTLDRRHGLVTTQTTQIARSLLDAAGEDAYAIVDVIGIGAGVVDQLRQAGHKVGAFNAGERTDRTDVSGELGFLNKRSASWWSLRELLDPDRDGGSQIALPPDDLLLGELTAPGWTVSARGDIVIESKDEVKRRLGRSTDAADAVVMAFWPEAPVPKIATITAPTDSAGLLSGGGGLAALRRGGR